MVIEILVYLILIILAYLIGCFLPGYFIAKIKGINILKKGYKLPGTSNVKKVLGIKYAIITFLYDFIKPSLIFLVALIINSAFNLNLNQWFIFALPFVTILGHMFPFYLKFKGGHGIASSFGFLLLLFSFLIYKRELSLIAFLIALTIFIIVFIFVKKKTTTELGLISGTYLLLLFSLIFFKPLIAFIILLLHLLFILGNLIYFNFIEKVQKKEIKKEYTEHSWRKWLRPLASIFPIGFLFFQKPILALALIVFTFFIVIEILKYAKIRKIEKVFYRKKEKHKLSSFTYFFLGLIITLAIFEKYIATLSLFILIFSDLASFSIGVMYGKRKIINSKSVIGTLAFFASSLAIALAYYKFFNFSLILGISASIIASLLEILSIKINDNLLIPIGTSFFVTIIAKII